MLAEDYFLHELFVGQLVAMWVEWQEALANVAKGFTLLLLFVFVFPWVFRGYYGRFKRYIIREAKLIVSKGSVITQGHASFLDLIDSLDTREHSFFPKFLPRTHSSPNQGYHYEMLTYFDRYGRKHHIGDYDAKATPYPLPLLFSWLGFFSCFLYPLALLFISFRSLDMFCFFLAIVVPVMAIVAAW